MTKKNEIIIPEVVKIEDGLVVIPPETVPALFSKPENIDHVVGLIKKEVSTHVPDLTTAKGRKETLSLAHSVSKSKVVIEDLGKALVKDLKEQAKVIDVCRKTARDTLDELRDEIKRPVVEWQEEQDRIAREEQERKEEELRLLQEAAQLEIDHELALQLNELHDRRLEQEAKDRELEALREEKRQREEQERIRQEERERVERETQEEIARVEREKKEAIAQAQWEAEEKVRLEREERDRIERERIAREERERIAEEQRLEAERIERERKANLTRHRNKVKKEILAALEVLWEGDGSLEPIDVFKLIDAGKVPHITINY